MMKRLDSVDPLFERDLDNLLNRDESDVESVDSTVAAILTDVRLRGNEAVMEFTNRFDRRRISSAEEMQMPVDQLHEYLQRIDKPTRDALQHAYDRIVSFHDRQKETSWQYEEEDGTRLGQIVNPLQRVGVYVPGGKAAYPSSVLMNVGPARVAGVDEIVMVVPTPDGDINETVMAAAAIAGVDRVFTIGGAQAVAALAFGTETIPRVDKIVGPGNIYVAVAKKQVFGHVGIDMIAGPSEVAVICDSQADADWVAMDLFAQAEHDEMAQSIVICPDQDKLNQIAESINTLLPDMERHEIIRKSLDGQGAMIKVRDFDEAVKVANRIAPEHLELMVDDPESLISDIRNAGAVFAGYYSAESLGDYCAGPNHVLPTSGTARFSSPLGVYDFQKRSSLIMSSRHGAVKLAKTASRLARSESLTAHARSAEYRLAKTE